MLHRVPSAVAAGLLAAAISGAAGAADLSVTATDPVRHTAASPFTSIRVTFDRPVNPASVTPASFRVFGRWSGAKSGTFSFSNGGRTVTFDPSTGFSAGEAVFVNLARTIAAADLSTLRSAGHAFAFRIATAPAPAQFQEIDVMSNRSGFQTRIYGATASDLNEDGWLDLTTVNEVSADVRVCLNRGDGSGLYDPFLAPQGIGSHASPNEPADFNNDGHADLCVAASVTDDMWVMLGAGDGTFFSVVARAAGNEPHGIAVLDADGDADPDIVTANRLTNNLALFLNDGSGGFGTPTFFDGGVSGEYGLASADMNNDGITDLVVAGRDGQHAAVMLGNGNATFTAAGPAQTTGGSTWVIVTDDLNGDGNMDATTANSQSNSASRILGNGDGTFGAPLVLAIGGHTVATDTGDLDGDGDSDWVVSSFGGGYWRIYRNDGSGNFSFDQQITAPDNPSCAILLDFDNDGDLDMTLSDEIADVLILMRNTGSVGVPGPAPPGLALLAGEPNPFRAEGGTRLRFSLPGDTPVRLLMFDVRGRLVASRDLGARAAGWQEWLYDGRDARGRFLRDGLYFYRLVTRFGAGSGRLAVAR